MVWLLKDEP